MDEKGAAQCGPFLLPAQEWLLVSHSSKRGVLTSLRKTHRFSYFESSWNSKFTVPACPSSL